MRGLRYGNDSVFCDDAPGPGSTLAPVTASNFDQHSATASWILVDTRLCIGQGKMALPGRRQSRRKEQAKDLDESKATTEQRREP